MDASASAQPKRKNEKMFGGPVLQHFSKIEPSDASGNNFLCKVCSHPIKVRFRNQGTPVLTSAEQHLRTHRIAGNIQKRTKHHHQPTIAECLARKQGARRLEDLRVAVAELSLVSHNPHRSFYDFSDANRFNMCLHNVPDMFRDKMVALLENIDVHSIRQEMHAHFLTLLRRYIDECLSVSMGNPFAHATFHCDWLEGLAFIALSLTFTDVECDRTFSALVAFERMDGPEPATVAAQLQKMCLNATGRPYAAIVHSATGTCVVEDEVDILAVLCALNHERERPGLHGDAEVLQYMCGPTGIHSCIYDDDETHPTEPAMDLVRLCNYHLRKLKPSLDKVRDTIPGGCPDINFKKPCWSNHLIILDELHLSLLWNKAVKKVISSPEAASANAAAVRDFQSLDWQAALELEAVFDMISSVTSRWADDETQMGAMEHLAHRSLLRALRSTELMVLDLDAITQANPTPRKPVSTAGLTEISKVMLERAVDVVEKRLLGGVPVGVDGTKRLPPRSRRETLAMLLDPRTNAIVKKWPRAELQAAMELLCEEYQTFVLTAERPWAFGPLAGDPASLSGPKQASLSEWERQRREELKHEFRAEYKAFADATAKINWSEYAAIPGVAPGGVRVPSVASEVDVLKHLLPLNVYPALKTVFQNSKYLRRMVTHSRVAVHRGSTAACAKVVRTDFSFFNFGDEDMERDDWDRVFDYVRRVCPVRCARKFRQYLIDRYESDNVLNSSSEVSRKLKAAQDEELASMQHE